MIVINEETFKSAADIPVTSKLHNVVLIFKDITNIGFGRNKNGNS